MLTTVVFSALMGAMQLFARQLPSDSAHSLQHLDVCGGHVCFMGVAPKDTSWMEARRLLSAYADLSDDPSPVLTGKVDQISFNLQMAPDGNNIGFFMLNYPDVSLKSILAVLLARFGIPCLVSLNFDSDAVELHYPSMIVTIPIASVSDVDGKKRYAFYAITSILVKYDATIPDLCVDLNGSTLPSGSVFDQFVRYLYTAFEAEDFR